MTVVHLDRQALGYALAVEAVLAGLAVFGGPHGTLGAWPWTLQLPGILLVFFVSGEAPIALRIAGMVLIQSVLWYGVIAGARHIRRVRSGDTGRTP